MVAVPFAAYKLAGDVVLAGMEDAGQRTMYAGGSVAANVAALVVLRRIRAVGGRRRDRPGWGEEDGKKDD